MIRRLRARIAPASPESGAISAMVVTLIVMLFMLAGLVVDGGFAINARQRAFDDAEQAARQGANQIDLEALRATGQVVLLESQARQRATGYLLARGYDPSEIDVNPSVGAGEVNVVVRDTVDTTLLKLIFIPPFTVRGEATSRPAVGITEEVQ